MEVAGVKSGITEDESFNKPVDGAFGGSSRYVPRKTNRRAAPSSRRAAAKPLAMRGIGSAEERERTRDELARVLKPGATPVLADIDARERASALTAVGMRDVRSDPGRVNSYCLFAPTTAVTAAAPG